MRTKLVDDGNKPELVWFNNGSASEMTDVVSGGALNSTHSLI